VDGIGWLMIFAFESARRNVCGFVCGHPHDQLQGSLKASWNGPWMCTYTRAFIMVCEQCECLQFIPMEVELTLDFISA